MPSSFAAGTKANGLCDRCGQQYKLKKLKELSVNDSHTNMLVCPECWEPDHPQNKLGEYLVVDPQALRNPRSDASELVASRNIQYGWRPVGFSDPLGLIGLHNDLEGVSAVGTVTITTS